jgi:hypothetical protein
VELGGWRSNSLAVESAPAEGPHHQFQNIQNKALIDIFHWYLCHGNISIVILILRKQNLNWYLSERKSPRPGGGLHPP